MIDHNVMRLHVAVHDALAVAVVKGLEKLKDVVADVDIDELGVQGAEVGVVDVFEDERGCLALRIPDNVEQGDNVGPAGQVLQDLDLALYLLLLDGLEDLDDAFLVVNDVDALEDLGVFAAACNEKRSAARVRVGARAMQTHQSSSRPRSFPRLPSLRRVSDATLARQNSQQSKHERRRGEA
jgi:hypothetical protein